MVDFLIALGNKFLGLQFELSDNIVLDLMSCFVLDLMSCFAIRFCRVEISSMIIILSETGQLVGRWFEDWLLIVDFLMSIPSSDQRAANSYSCPNSPPKQLGCPKHMKRTSIYPKQLYLSSSWQVYQTQAATAVPKTAAVVDGPAWYSFTFVGEMMTFCLSWTFK